MVIFFRSKTWKNIFLKYCFRETHSVLQVYGSSSWKENTRERKRLWSPPSISTVQCDVCCRSGPTKTFNTILTRFSREKGLWSSPNVFSISLSFSFVFLLSWGLSGHKVKHKIWQVLKYGWNGNFTHPFWYFAVLSVILKSALKTLR